MVYVIYSFQHIYILYCISTYLGPLSFYNVTDEVRHGLASTFTIQCTCGHNNEIKTSQEHRSGKGGPAAFDVNTRIPLGCLHAGIGQSHIYNLLSTANTPTLNSSTLRRGRGKLGRLLTTLQKSAVKNHCRWKRQRGKPSSFNPMFI